MAPRFFLLLIFSACLVVCQEVTEPPSSPISPSTSLSSTSSSTSPSTSSTTSPSTSSTDEEEEASSEDDEEEEDDASSEEALDDLEAVVKEGFSTLKARLSDVELAIFSRMAASTQKLQDRLARVEAVLTEKLAAAERRLSHLEVEASMQRRQMKKALRRRLRAMGRGEGERSKPARSRQGKGVEPAKSEVSKAAAAVLESCQAYRDAGFTRSGRFLLDVQDKEPSIPVWCDMETQGEGWVVIQRRQDGSENFYRSWVDYQNGFGDLNGELWLGTSKLHRLTARGLRRLRVELRDWSNSTAVALYSHFFVFNASHQYRLRVGGYTGTAGDAMAENNNQKFSTPDRDNDVIPGNHCALETSGSWWHGTCGDVNPNGRYGVNGSYGHAFIVWRTWRGYWGLQGIEMKIR